MDAVVVGYVQRALASLFDIDKCFAEQDDRFRENVVMALLESMVACGAATHSYDQKQNTDEFYATERLVRNWDQVFPGDKFDIDQSEKNYLEISQKRSRYFNKDWLAPGKGGTLPVWPS